MTVTLFAAGVAVVQVVYGKELGLTNNVGESAAPATSSVPRRLSSASTPVVCRRRPPAW